MEEVEAHPGRLADPNPRVWVLPIRYAASVACQNCDYRTRGSDTRVAGITHVKQTGHTIDVDIEATEEIKPA